jgi:hypothetical protein
VACELRRHLFWDAGIVSTVCAINACSCPAWETSVGKKNLAPCGPDFVFRLLSAFSSSRGDDYGGFGFGKQSSRSSADASTAAS